MIANNLREVKGFIKGLRYGVSRFTYREVACWGRIESIKFFDQYCPTFIIATVSGIKPVTYRADFSDNDSTLEIVVTCSFEESDFRVNELVLTQLLPQLDFGHIFSFSPPHSTA